MISNEQRAHEIAIALLSKKEFNSPVDAYHEYINVLLPILKEFDKDFPDGIAEHPGRQLIKKRIVLEVVMISNTILFLFL